MTCVTMLGLQRRREVVNAFGPVGDNRVQSFRGVARDARKVGRSISPLSLAEG
jgi:hypothetical protein